MNAHAAPRSEVDTTIVVPTFNEGHNVGELVRRLGDACTDLAAEVLFVDDSTDDTPELIQRAAEESPLPVRLLHRSGSDRTGGLAGAVTRGVEDAHGSWLVVMDGDLQHPPEMVPTLRHRASEQGADVVVASRYAGDGDASGLGSAWRRQVSSGSTLLARATFPRRVGRQCTDPMTGFFCLRRSAVQPSSLHPRGFKILLEILARHDLRVHEVPFAFGQRRHGESKASWRQGWHFLRQLADLRFGRMLPFGLVGATGFVLNLAVMAALIGVGAHYLVAAVIATELAIVSNFLLQERFVFGDLRTGGRTVGLRAAQSLGFNNVEHLARIPVLVALVEFLAVPELLAQASTLAAAFLGRFLFVSRVVYRPRPGPAVAGVAAELEAA